MIFCELCGNTMIDIACYDPEGVIPLMIKEVDGTQLTCIICSKKAEEGELPK